MCTYPLPQLQKNCVCTLFTGLLTVESRCSPWPWTSDPPPFTFVEITSLCHLLMWCWGPRRALCMWGKHSIYGVTSLASPVLLIIVSLKAGSGSRQLNNFFLNLNIRVGLCAMVCVVEARSLELEFQVIVNGRGSSGGAASAHNYWALSSSHSIFL